MANPMEQEMEYHQKQEGGHGNWTLSEPSSGSDADDYDESFLGGGDTSYTLGDAVDLAYGEDEEQQTKWGPLQAQTGEGEAESYQASLTGGDEGEELDDEQFTLADYENTEGARAVYTPGEAPEDTPERYDEGENEGMEFAGGDAIGMIMDDEVDIEYEGDEGDDSEAYIGPPSGSTGRREVGQIGSSRDYGEAAGGDEYSGEGANMTQEEVMEMMDKALEAGYQQGKRQQQKGGGEFDSMEDLLKMHKVLDNSGLGEFKSIATAAYLVNQYRQGGQEPEEDDVLSEMRQELRDRYGGGGSEESYEGAWKSVLGDDYDDDVYESLSDVNPGDASVSEVREQLVESGVSGDEANEVLARYTTQQREGTTPTEDMREAYAGEEGEDVDYEQSELPTGVEAEAGEEGGGLIGRLKGYTGRLFGGSDEDEGSYETDDEQAELTDTDRFGKEDEGYESDEEREAAEQQIAEEEARAAAEEEGYSVEEIRAGKKTSSGREGTAILDDGTEVPFVRDDEGIDLLGRENDDYASAIEEYGSLDEDLDRPGLMDRIGDTVSGVTDYVGSAAEGAGGYLSGLFGGGSEPSEAEVEEEHSNFMANAGKAGDAGDALSDAVGDLDEKKEEFE